MSPNRKPHAGKSQKNRSSDSTDRGGRESNRDMVDTPEKVEELCDLLDRENCIAFDTEFIRENTFFPQLEIIQIATQQEVWLVDVPAFKKRANGTSAAQQLKPLLDILQSPDKIKIVHAALGDQECLFTSFGMTASPILDTSVAAALCGYGDGIGLGNLLKASLGVKIKKGHARTNWAVRPLPSQLISYAKSDVSHLVDLGQTLMEELNELGRRNWAFELSSKLEDPKLFVVDPEVLAKKLFKSGRIDREGYPVLVELIKWREKRVRELNIPKKRLADDGVLMDLARVRPKDYDHLKTFRGLNKGELKDGAKNLLGHIRQGLDNADKAPARSPRMNPPTGRESRMIDLLRCYVGFLADQKSIAPKHLLSGDQFLKVLRSDAKKAEDLVADDILSQGACDLIGKELVSLLKGDQALTLRSGELQIVPISGRSTSGKRQ